MKDWSKLSWQVVRVLVIKVLQLLISKITGPVGLVVSTIISIFVDKIIKPFWQLLIRKFKNKKRQEDGEKRVKEIRNASTKDIDNIYDNLRK